MNKLRAVILKYSSIPKVVINDDILDKDSIRMDTRTTADEIPDPYPMVREKQ